MKNLTLTFLYMEREHIGKDVSCVPLYLGKALQYNVTIVSLSSQTNRDMPKVHDGIHYHMLFLWGTRNCGWYKLVFFWWYLIRHSRHIDLLMRFHYSIPTMVEVILYKLINPNGKTYIKCDADLRITERFSTPSSTNIIQRLKLALFRKGIRAVDVISCETTEVYNLLLQSESPYFNFKDKLVLAPNGFDEGQLCDMNITPRCFESKENIMITVARLGSYEKNTEMILEALALTDLRDWVFYLIGPFDREFQTTVKLFFEKYPQKKEQVIFTGPVYDKKQLWEFYDRAKVFVMTSRHESYGLVLNEAKRFANYVVSTDVGAAKDIILNRFGELIPQDDPRLLALSLNRIVDGTTLTDVYCGYNSEELSWDSCLRSVIDKLTE